MQSHICQSWRSRRLSIVGQLGFLDSGTFYIFVVEESLQLGDFSADSVPAPLHQS